MQHQAVRNAASSGNISNSKNLGNIMFKGKQVELSLDIFKWRIFLKLIFYSEIQVFRVKASYVA